MSWCDVLLSAGASLAPSLRFNLLGLENMLIKMYRCAWYEMNHASYYQAQLAQVIPSPLTVYQCFDSEQYCGENIECHSQIPA